jgi:predicted signal transduction protein with EAL and GGDEF domain
MREQGAPPPRAADLFRQHVHGLELRLTPVLGLVLLACALALPLFTGEGADPVLAAGIWGALIATPAASASIVAWRRRRRAVLPAATRVIGAHVALVLVGGAALGLAAADLAGPDVAASGWRLLPLTVAACVAGLATVVARRLRFALLAAACLAPLALRGASQAPALTGVVLGLYAVLLLGHGLLSMVLAASLRSEAEQRARLSRLEFTNEALFADRQQLHTESRTDPLTGLANRRQMEETLHSEWNRCRRSASPLSCVLIDIRGLAARSSCCCSRRRGRRAPAPWPTC